MGKILPSDVERVRVVVDERPVYADDEDSCAVVVDLGVCELWRGQVRGRHALEGLAVGCSSGIPSPVFALVSYLHRFNMQTILPERGITIDEALILLAQLSGRKERLNGLASRQPKERLGDRYFGSGSGPIEYRYANYDVARAEADYRAVADEIAALQLELDLVNQTEVFSIEL